MNERPPRGEPIWNLIDAACSGTLEDQQVAELEERLKADPAARQLFADYCLMHADIRFHASAEGAVKAARQKIEALISGTAEEFASPESIEVLRSVASKPAPVRNRPGNALGFASLAASMATAALVWLMLMDRPPWKQPSAEQPPAHLQAAPQSHGMRELVDWNRSQAGELVEVEGFVAQFTRGYQVHWEDVSTAPFLGQYLPAGQTLKLTRGVAELSLFSGSKLILEGPVEFILHSKSGGSLARGRITAQLNGRSRGFQIKTPTALIIDLGTEFGVEVDTQGDTQVHVLDGVVQVALLREGQPSLRSIRLTADESLTVRKEDSTTVLGAAEPQRFVRGVPLAADRLLALVGDNLITRYDFDDAKNLSRNSGSGRDGILQAVTATSGIPPIGFAGDFGGDDLRSVDVAVEDVAAFSPGGSEGRGLTVAAWVKTTCIDQRGNIFFAYNSPREDDDTRRDIVLLELEYGGLPNVFVRDDSYGNEINLVHNQGIADGKWHHLALTLSPGAEKTLSLYVDGMLTCTKSDTIIGDVDLQRARIGRRLCEQVTDDNDFQGAIDEAVILNRALKPTEVRTLYDATKPTWL